jgi:hypothetical protein
MSLIGCVDKLWDTCVSGWAADDADPDKAVQVDVIVNSALVATVPCAAFREDLRAAGIGDGRKGFRFDPNSYLKPGRNQLEVRYAGSDQVVPNGRGVWTAARRGRLPEAGAAFVAALEAYYEFRPEHHVCAIGKAAAEILREAGIKFRKLSCLEAPRGECAVGLAEKADLVVSLAWPTPVVESVQILQCLIQDHMNRPGFLAIGFAETPGIAGEIRRALEECGATQVKLESIASAEDGERRIFAFAEICLWGGQCWPQPPFGRPEPAESRLRAELPAPQASNLTPLLAHIHVPKCAGTAFRVLQERYFGPRHLGLYIDDTYFVFTQEALRGYLLQNPEAQGFSSHHVRVFPHSLAGREVLYVTFLRDPIQQFVSYMTHIKKHYATITAKSLLEAVPPDAPRLALREFARWLLTQERDIPFRENHNVKFFARHSAPRAEDRLAAAKAALEAFFFVGITERMEESMDRLRALARKAGLEFPPGLLPVENTSADCRDDLSWINPDDEVGSLLLRSVKKDRQLYDWAETRLNE